jgi:cysteine desulfurase
MGECFRIAKEEGMAEQAQLKVLRDKLWAGLSSLEQVFLNGDARATYCR